jgi:hypothetical protein
VYWKLRIPLFFLVLGTLSGLFEKFPKIGEGFFLLLGVLFFTFVKVKIFERKVHFSIGIGLIFLGVLFEQIIS